MPTSLGCVWEALRQTTGSANLDIDSDVHIVDGGEGECVSEGMHLGKDWSPASACQVTHSPHA